MENNYLVGIDIGTQGTKAAIFDMKGACLAQGFQKSNLLQKAHGTIEENPEEQVEAVCNSIHQCMISSKINPAEVSGLAISGQMAGIIGIDEEGKNITPYDSWLDTRCEPYIKMMEERAGDRIMQQNGYYPSYNHGPKILWWKHEYPGIYSTIAAFVQPGGYAAMRLCGLKASDSFIDNTYLHFSGFSDNRMNSWDQELCKEFDVDINKMPAIVMPDSHIGNLSKKMAARCGLKEGTPVMAGCGDTAASFLSVGATREGICVDVAGTASVFATTTSQFITDNNNKVLGCGHSASRGLWHPYAYINGGGMNLEWFLKEAAKLNKNDDDKITFQQLNEQVSGLEAKPDDPYFIPHLGGRVCPSQPHLRGAWANLNWSHGFAHMYKAVMEAVALEYGLYNEILKEAWPEYQPKEIRVTGGGSKSEIWNQQKADVLGIPVVKSHREEGAPLGSALIAGKGAGLFDDLDEVAQQWCTTGSQSLPDKALKAHYLKRIKNYEKLMDMLGKLEF